MLSMTKCLTNHSQEKLETIRYNATLVINGAVKGSSKERLDQELCLQSIADSGFENYAKFPKSTKIKVCIIYKNY